MAEGEFSSPTRLNESPFRMKVPNAQEDFSTGRPLVGQGLKGTAEEEYIGCGDVCPRD
jgi:hypothetical protein